jgi:hypothetical protein
MAVIDAKKALTNLKKKGFLEVTGDHKFLIFHYNGKEILHTKISHGAKDLDDYLIKRMALQCNLDKNDFKKLVECPLSKEKYIELLKEKGLIK